MRNSIQDRVHLLADKAAWLARLQDVLERIDSRSVKLTLRKTLGTQANLDFELNSEEARAFLIKAVVAERDILAAEIGIDLKSDK